MNVFLLWLIGFYPLKFFYYMSPFDSPLQNELISKALSFTFKGPKSKLKLRILSNEFLV